MSHASSIPENVLRYRPCKCTRLKNDNGTYRVYRYKAMKLPSGKWSNSAGDLIGKIIPNVGFIPNRRYQKELDTRKREELRAQRENDEITDHAYGQYALLLYLSKDVLLRLKECFPMKKALQIYSYALILCAKGFIHVDQVDDAYRESFLSVLYKDYSFKMGSTALTNLLHDLGMKGNPVTAFEQGLIDDSSGNIAIDGHVVRSCSNFNSLAEPGYKMNLLKAPQINILIAYDMKNKVPLMYRAYRGSSVDKKSCEQFLQSRSFQNVKFVVDRGFYSEKILSLMSRNGCCYIIPVPKNNRNFKRIMPTIRYSSGEFVYKTGRRHTARITYYEESIDKKTRMIFFMDADENNSKRKCFRQYMEEGETGYTQECYDRNKDLWGVYVLQTNSDEPAPEVFDDYKKRWSIETYNNYIKNDADFNDLKLQDYYNLQGFNFIMLVSGMIHARLNAAVSSLQKSSISTYDILSKSGMMRMVLEDEKWRLFNTRTKDLALLREMGFEPEAVYPRLDGENSV